MGFGVVMWQVGPLPLVPAFLVGVSVNPDSFTSDTAPCQCSGKAAEDGPGTWLCAANVEDPDGTCGFDVNQCWLLWSVVIWGVNQWTGKRFIILFQIK